MSTTDSHATQIPAHFTTEVPRKRPRVRACDQCRRRKVRCDTAEVKGPRCTSCAHFNFECTFAAGADTRFCDIDYVKGIERELEEMRQLCRKQEASLKAYTELAESVNSRMEAFAPMVASSPTPTSCAGELITEDDKDDTVYLIKSFKDLDLNRHDLNYIGRSSSLTLIRTAVEAKQDYVQSSEKPAAVKEHALTYRRPEYWSIRSPIQPEPPYTDFPNPTLMDELVTKYFDVIHSVFPLLHRPTFKHGIRSGLHLRDEGFGATLLLVCAVAAKLSDDPEVLPKDLPSWQWSGWHYFEQVRAKRKLMPLTTATLYDLQVACLSAAYLADSALILMNCALIAYGLRTAQDMGLHRRTTYGTTPTVDGELKKRAFWCLLSLERSMCIVMGRSSSVRDDDFDVDFPIECDDEYWMNYDQQLAFKQPEGKPAIITYFIWTLRQGHIIDSIFRNLYSPHAAKVLADAERAQAIVSELDSELNEWVDSIPEHLRGDRDQSDLFFADQSVALYASSYLLRIMIHRQFISLPGKPSSLPFPSLTICTSAARSAVQVVYKNYCRFGPSRVLPDTQLILLTSAIILLLNIWGGKRIGLATDTAQEMALVDNVLTMLKAIEIRFNSAGRLWDILHDLRTIVDDPTQQQLRMQKRKREDSATPGDGLPIDAGIDAQQPRRGFQQPTMQPDSTLVSSAFDSDFSLDLPMSSGKEPPSGTAFDFANLWESFGGQLDPDLESIFAGLLSTPSSYDDPFSGLSQGLAVHTNLFSLGPLSAGTSGMQPVPSLSDLEASTDGHQAAGDIWNAGAEGSPWTVDSYLTGLLDTTSAEGLASTSVEWPGEPST